MDSSITPQRGVVRVTKTADIRRCRVGHISPSLFIKGGKKRGAVKNVLRKNVADFIQSKIERHLPHSDKAKCNSPPK
ncbi:hypothetical protein RvY_08600 [Ramazzottius varieornatus]|uniref:Uncharacterized protein n=1 Tax=Ramazzottius varieornatus TaxID=947166 RepID=A0A1D1V6H8_RAMVA|nr:hypothetical protein RvY_08600 [Ramazzottius varieornatus]